MIHWKRLLMIGMIGGAVCVSSPLAAQAQVQMAPKDSQAPSQDAVLQRLNEILKRLDAIEARLSTLEATVAASNDLWIDEHGVLRNGSGRPVGFWGIDDPLQMEVKLRR